MTKKTIERIAKQLSRLAHAEPFEPVEVDADVLEIWRLLLGDGVVVSRIMSVQKALVGGKEK